MSSLLPWETVPFVAVRTERKKEINSEKREKAEGRGARRVEGGQNQIEGTNNRGGGGGGE